MELTWENANNWQADANKNKRENEPKWDWDCHFKLDFDGSLIRVESRFYPPARHYGPGWDGGVRILLIDEIIIERNFQCESLEELKKEVEQFVSDFKKNLKVSL